MGADLYHTFAFPHVEEVPPGSRIVTGITAHVWETWGADRVRTWAMKAVAVHANSRLLETEMRELLPSAAVFYAPNGVCPKQFHRTRPRAVVDRLVVGHIGKPNPRKGAAIIERACEIAGVELRTIQRRSSEALPVEAMLDFYQDLHLTATASNMDGTPNPALEGAACEVAPLSNRIGNMPEFIEGGANGFLVERDVDAYVERLRWAKDHLGEVEAMGRAARWTVLDEWSWRRQSEWVRTLWRAALEGDPR